MDDDHHSRAAGPTELHSTTVVLGEGASLPSAGSQTKAIAEHPRTLTPSPTGSTTSKGPASITKAPGATKSFSRTIKDGPWCWLSKITLTQILAATGETNGAVCNGRSVYLALCELASDAGTERFTATKSLIGYRAGLSIRTVQRVLADLERAGVVEIGRNATGIRTASSYTLKKTNASPSSRNDSTSGHGEVSELADMVKERKELKEPIAPTGAVGAVGANRSSAQPIPGGPCIRDPLLESLASLGGSDPAQVTPKAWRAIAVALDEIRTVCPDVTPDEIRRRATSYRQHMPQAMPTAHALAKHWAQCDHLPQPAKPAPQPQRDYTA